jgi:hypothetical protein
MHVSKPSRPEREEMRLEDDMLMDETPEETAAERMLLDDEEVDEDVFLADRDVEFARRRNQGNQPGANPPED